MIFEGSGWKVNVVLGLFQVDWGSALLQIVTLWSVMVVLWKKRHKILVFSINNQWNSSVRLLDHEKYESKWLGCGCGDRNDRWDVCWCWLSQKIDWTSAWMRCKVECLISFELHLSSCGWTRRKVVNDNFRLLLSAEGLFWGWNSKWVLVGWCVPKENAWQVWMRFSRLFAVSLKVYLKISLGGRRNELKMNENVVIFLVVSAWLMKNVW